MEKEEILSILKAFESYKINVKGIHWNANGITEKNTHLICDEIYSKINGFQDTVAEYYMGVTFDPITPADFHVETSLMYDTPSDILIVFSEYLVELHQKLSETDGTIWIGLKSEIESFIAETVKLRYLSPMA